jgi:hypothetical protein
MPIPAHKALRWASDPATHALMMLLAHTPESDTDTRRIKENRLLRHASRLCGLPKGCIPIGQQREQTLLWLVTLINKTLELHLHHDSVQPPVPTLEAQASDTDP